PCRRRELARGPPHRGGAAGSRRIVVRGDRRCARPRTGNGSLATAPSANGSQGQAGTLLDMTCDQARERFGEWVDETLPLDDHAALAAHLAQCAECPRELDRFAGAIGLLHALGRPRAPAGFVDRLLQSARPTPSYHRLFERLFVPFRVKIPAEAPAIVLIAGLALFLFERTPELEQAARPEESRGAVHAPAPPPAAPRTIAPD